MFVVRRSNENPIITPNAERPWESYAAFNGCPIQVGTSIKLVYRAMSQPEKFENNSFSLSTIGIAESHNGVHFKNHAQFIAPEEPWERYGCEDPRVTKIGGKYYIFYTAISAFPFTAPGIRVAVAISENMETVTERHLVTPFNAKAMTLFPEKINGKFTAILTAHTDMRPSKTAIAQFDREEDMWSEEYWNEWHAHLDDHAINLKRGDNERVEIGSQPIKTKHGWLLIYSHIRNYGVPGTIFGIEAVLLDRYNPKKIIARTNLPIIVPQEQYEKYGVVPDIAFPSGGLVIGDTLHVYYGGADTVCATAAVRLDDLLDSMIHGPDKIFTRSKKNPILAPTDKAWEKRAVFNPAIFDHRGTIHLLYRAMSEDNTSVVGYAATHDGIHISKREPDPIYKPRESFEDKRVQPSGNSGCEDPRVTLIGETLYMCYTAYNGAMPPAVAMSHIKLKEFLKREWNWSKPVLISPTGVDDKDACIVEAGMGKKQLLIHRIDHAICMSGIDLNHPLPPTEYKIVLRPRPGMWDSRKVGLSAPPLKTEHGWLTIYHGIADDGVYRAGVVLFDKKDPTKVIARTTSYIFEPKELYEREGQVGNVVFPCGLALRGKTLYMYYGAADQTVGVATANIKDILRILL